MPLQALAIVVLAVLLALFVAVNWTAFMTPATLSVIFWTVQAPLGLVMLVVTGFVAGLSSSPTRFGCRAPCCWRRAA